jgi:hypothetical protein
MNIPKMPLSTKAILAYRSLNRRVDDRWAEWALSMLKQNYYSDHLYDLAADSPPFDQTETIELADKIFKELGLDWSDTEHVVREYVVELLQDMLRGAKSSQDVLDDLMHICVEMDYPKDLFRFYLLHFAQDDLRDSDFSGHLPEANRSNIQTMVNDYAREWLSKFKDAA